MNTGTLPPVSNVETWTNEIKFFDDENDDPLFLEADASTHPTEITMKLRDIKTGGVVLSGSLTGGDIAISGDGVATFTFDIGSLAPKTYRVGLLYTQDDFTTQIILGDQPILEGL